MFVAFVAGLATVLSPCALPFVPIILTYYLQDQRSTLGGAIGGGVVVGGLVTFALPFGLLITVFHLWVTPAVVTTYFERVAGGVLVVFGILTVLNIHTPFFFPNIATGEGRGYRTLYTLGILYGLAGIGCTIWPFLSVGLLATLSPVSAVVVYTTYVATVAVPLLIMGFFAAEVRELVVGKVARHARWIRVGGGIVLLGAGLYLLSYGADSFLPPVDIRSNEY